MAEHDVFRHLGGELDIDCVTFLRRFETAVLAIIETGAAFAPGRVTRYADIRIMGSTMP